MDGESLPRDMADLHAQADLCSFLSVPVTAGSQVLGSLLLAAAKPGAFDEPWWRPMAKMAGTALLPHLRNRQVRRHHCVRARTRGLAPVRMRSSPLLGTPRGRQTLACLLPSADRPSWPSIHPNTPQLLHLCRTLVCVDSEEDPREAVGQILYVSCVQTDSWVIWDPYNSSHTTAACPNLPITLQPYPSRHAQRPCP